MHPSVRPGAIMLLLAIALVVGCENQSADPPPAESPAATPEPEATPPAPPADPGAVEFTAPPPPIPRLTADQYTRSIHAVFGEDVTVPSLAEPETRVGGLIAVGAGVATLSRRTVESLERAAFAVAEQALTPERRDRVLPCSAEAVDDSCLEGMVERVGRLLWRRPLTVEERGRVVAIGQQARDTLGAPLEGAIFALATLLQSPHFLFRRELGERAGDHRTYTGYELASRLSFLLWNTAPDEALLDEAEAGLLDTPDGLAAAAERMLDDPRAVDGVMRLFEEWLGLDGLKGVSKDPRVFTRMSPELPAAARAETLLGLTDLVFTRDADFREFLTGHRTFVDRKLAALYGVPAPAREGFAPVELPVGTRRRGFLGQISFLALHSYPTSTSATLRGKFVREQLLCQAIPQPPADVDTAIPEPSGTRRTLRERVAEHLENPACNSCHQLTDPIGLAFENFDGLGVWRAADNGETIDPAGTLDRVAFRDGAALSELLAEHPNFPFCVARQVFRYGTASLDEEAQEQMVSALADQFVADDHRFRGLLLTFISSPAFRMAGQITDDVPGGAE